MREVVGDTQQLNNNRGSQLPNTSRPAKIDSIHSSVRRVRTNTFHLRLVSPLLLHHSERLQKVGVIRAILQASLEQAPRLVVPS